MEEKRNVKKRILITVVILFLIQLLAGIPTPGVNLNLYLSKTQQLDCLMYYLVMD